MHLNEKVIFTLCQLQTFDKFSKLKVT